MGQNVGTAKNPNPPRIKIPGLLRCRLQSLQHRPPPSLSHPASTGCHGNQLGSLPSRGGWVGRGRTAGWVGTEFPCPAPGSPCGSRPGFTSVPWILSTSPHATPGQKHSLFSAPHFVFGSVSTGIYLCPVYAGSVLLTPTLSSPRVQTALNPLGNPELRSHEGLFLVPHHLVSCFLLW